MNRLSWKGPRVRLAAFLALAVLALLLLFPGAAAAGVGRLAADLWVSTMAAVAGLVGAMFGR